MRTSLVAPVVMLGTLAVAPVWTPIPVDAAGLGIAVAATGGMGTPEAAVQELLASVGAADPLGLLAVLHPDERHLVDTLYMNATTIAEGTGGVDVAAMLRALYIDVRPGPLMVEQLTGTLAWVTTARAEVTARVDVGALDEAIATELSDDDAVNEFHDALTPQVDHLGVAVVNDGGQWFVSALYTAAEIARRNADLPAEIGSATVTSVAAATPTDAVSAVAAAVELQDPAALAAVLTPYEAGLVTAYAPTLGAELLNALGGTEMAVDLSRTSVVAEDTSWAIVETDRWAVSAARVDDVEGGFDWQLTVDGYCGEFREWFDPDGAGSDVDGMCAFTDDSIFNVVGVLRDGNWRGPRFVTVNHGGGWSVSLLQTALNALAPLTTDAVTLAGVGEVLLGWNDWFYESVPQILTTGQPPLPVGSSVLTPRANGRVALFRVSAGSTIAVELSSSPRECHIFVAVDDEFDRFEYAECGESVGPLSADGVAAVTTGSLMLSANDPLGDLTVTIS